jgi:serpin B
MLLWKSDKDVFARGCTEFAFDLLHKLNNQDKNLFFSPFNLSALCAMVYAGARGETAAQMAEALHFPTDHQTLHGQVADLNAQLLAHSTDYELRIGNRIWSQAGYPLLQSFLDIIAAHYQSGVEQVDFSQGQQTSQVINRWIEDQTGGLIKNLVDQGMLTPVTRVILTSAIYFKGLWLDPFRKEKTQDEEFWVTQERTVRTPIMHQLVGVPYAEYSDVQVVALPYRHLNQQRQPDVSMLIVLPRNRDELDKVSTRLDRRQLERWVNGLESQNVEVFLPRFRIESGHFLRGPMTELGMRNGFDPKTADFSGMTQAREPFWIDGLIQKAYVNVNEEGTEAAAAAATIYFGYMGGKRPPTPVFRADHPFLFLIRHNTSRNILFIGQVRNPQA